MKQRIVFIDQDVKTQMQVEFHLPDFEIISVNDYPKGVELCKKAAPDLILIGFLQKMDQEPIVAVRQLKRDPSTSQVPIIGLYNNMDRIRQEKDRQEGVESFLTKPINKELLIAKIRECLNNARAQKQYDSVKIKSHIKVDTSTPGLVKISFRSGLKFVLPEIKNIFNAEFLATIHNNDCCLDIRDFTSVSKEEASVLEKIVSVFGKKRIALVAGKHLGAIMTLSTLESKADLFMNIDDYLEFLKKPKTAQNIDPVK